MFWPIVIGLGALLASRDYETRAASRREDDYKKREADAVKKATELKEKEHREFLDKQKAKRIAAKTKRLERENHDLKIVRLKSSGS